jgi:hypothetical protein
MFNHPRYITLAYDDQAKKTILFTTGKLPLAKKVIVVFDQLKEKIPKYLNDSKWTEFSARYEAQHQRLVSLIESHDRPMAVGEFTARLPRA